MTSVDFVFTAEVLRYLLGAFGLGVICGFMGCAALVIRAERKRRQAMEKQ